MTVGTWAAEVPCRFSVCIASSPTMTVVTSKPPSTTHWKKPWRPFLPLAADTDAMHLSLRAAS